MLKITDKKIGLVIMITFLVVFSISNNVFAEEFNWRLAGQQPPETLDSQATEKFTELAYENSDGRINMDFYPAGQLGDSLAVIEMAKRGEIEVLANTSSQYTVFIEEWEILSFPYIIRDPEHLMAVRELDWFKNLEDEFYEEHQIKIIANNGFRLPRHLLHSSKALTTPEDIQGEEIRKADARIYVEPWDELGAEIAIIPWGETAVALQTGMVDGMGAPAHTIFPQKFYEGAPHVTLTAHQRDTLDFFMSATHWDKLTPELQEILVSSGEEALEWYSDQMDKTWTEHKEKLIADGVQFHEADIEAWEKRAFEIAAEWAEAGRFPEGLLEDIENLRE